MRRTSAIILLSISVVGMLILPACGFGLDEGQQLTLVQDLQIGTVSEGYLLSKNPTFATDDRDYMENDVLYVWVWSSSFDYANMNDFYCQLSSGGFEHKIFINPDQNMSQPNSYTGSFNLSRLEKAGDWSVRIYLRTSPPKPVTFEETTVINVSALPPTTHELSVSSSPISGVAFTLNGTSRTTFFSSVIDKGSYMIVMPSNVTVNGKTYNFVEWENRLTNPTRTVELADNKIVTAYFEEAKSAENLTSTITGIVTDNMGNPITDAKVTIVETEEFAFTVLEPAGQYTFENVTQGTYTLKVEAQGFNTTLTAVGVEPEKATTQNFSLTPSTTEEPQPEPDNRTDALQIGLVLLAAVGGAALLLLWKSRKKAMKTIKKTEYKKSLENVRLKAELEELDNLLQKGLLTKEEHEKLRTQTEEELSKISDTKG